MRGGEGLGAGSPHGVQRYLALLEWNARARAWGFGRAPRGVRTVASRQHSRGLDWLVWL